MIHALFHCRELELRKHPQIRPERWIQQGNPTCSPHSKRPGKIRDLDNKYQAVSGDSLPRSPLAFGLMKNHCLGDPIGGVEYPGIVVLQFSSISTMFCTLSWVLGLPKFQSFACQVSRAAVVLHGSSMIHSCHDPRYKHHDAHPGKCSIPSVFIAQHTSELVTSSF